MEISGRFDKGFMDYQPAVITTGESQCSLDDDSDLQTEEIVKTTFLSGVMDCWKD